VQLKIEKLVYGGDGLARLAADEHGPGKSVFVPFVLEGETVEAQLTEQKPGFSRARLERVIEPAGGRVQPGCPYFQRCGGCHYQHTSYADQLTIKSTILRETLRRTAKIDLPCGLEMHPSPEWNYRNRTRLKIQTAPEFAVGYYKFRSHDLLPIEQCPISSPLINRAITQLWTAGRDGKVTACLREIELFANGPDSELLVELYCHLGTTRREARGIAERFMALLPSAKGVAVFEQQSVNQVSEPPLIAHFGDAGLFYETKSHKYRVSAGAFFQANRFLIDELVDRATDGTSGKLALDLYAGVGLFSAVLARSFAQVIAVEASQTSLSDLRHNCGQEVKAVRATTEKYLAQSSGLHPDLVVADPPRGGLGENVVRSLARLDVPRIIYVSCDPSTLARDLRTFVALGYQIAEAQVIDLFPQTFHIESVFHLTR
jgi:23S rRNA (uracil1939-C5)-methyltransferase